MMDKPTLNIVLVEPRIPQNTGNVARTCACTACRLHLVGPMGFAIDDKKLKHAGLDYWHYLDITYYDGLADFFARNNGPYYYFTTKAPQRYTDVQYPDGAYFGVRPRGCRPAGGAACGKSGALHPHAHAGHLPQPEPFQQRGGGRVRGAAAVGFSGAAGPRPPTRL